MNVEIGAEAALFPEKEYISAIFVAVWITYGDSGGQLHTYVSGLIWIPRGHIKVIEKNLLS
jgi:hypothetical protein